MLATVIRTLYGYSAWANERVLDTAARLTPEQFAGADAVSDDSVRDTLIHILVAQRLWLSRWNGTAPGGRPGRGDVPDLAAVRAWWAPLERDTRDFVARLSDDYLARVVSYVNARGETWAYPLWQQMIQQVNHATQHRSEVAAMLTQFGHSPGDLDFLIYLDHQNAR
jgi:uncharacterized damage-inducible protein DinB